MTAPVAPRVPAQAWVVTVAGMVVNLCLGILYAWSVWKANLIATAEHPAGSPMSGLDAGWSYWTDAQATWAYAICGVTFAVFMIPGGLVQDKLGPRIGATLSGLLLGAGCVLAGLMKSYLGLIVGFGLLGGIGMGLGYAAATPAALKWFPAHRRGLVVGLVVSGYGGAAIYIAPLAKYLIAEHGISGSFIGLGLLFATVIVIAARFLVAPPEGYTVAALPASSTAAQPAAMTATQWPVSSMVGTWQFFALVFLFIGSAQSGLLVIANATPMLNATAQKSALFAAHGWLLASFGGLVNAAGRIATGIYSDRIGRANAYIVNGGISAVCLFLMPWIMQSGSVALLFAAVGIAYWQYGGGLSIMPAITADYFGTKDLGLKYGLVFIGWGIAFFVPQLAGYIKDTTGSLDNAFYLSGALLVAALGLARLTYRPQLPQ
ncbi:MAG TPA: MFS transporter [Pirellulales bacterium]|jgi:OFA family oxalate/formate antiporter-like MFS transporter|nr:MFS transporter [Pirellulales bacterium]